MLIALIGAPGSGKTSIAHYLASRHHFSLLALSDANNDAQNDFGGQKVVSLGDSKTMLDFVTDNWNKRYVTLDLRTQVDLEAFIKRPFFLCVEVDAPLLARWKRFCTKHGDLGLEQFAALDDRVCFGRGSSSITPPSMAVGTGMHPTLSSSSSLVGGNGIVDNLATTTLSSSPSPSALSSLRRYTHLSILNDLPSLSSLSSHLDDLNLTSESRLRPCWDTYFLRLCNLASLRSNCMKRRVGAVLVSSSNRILSTGYNGTPSGLRNCNQGGCARCNNTLINPSSNTVSSGCGQNLEECLCLHAEENALLEAGRAKIAAEGATMYCNTCPCLRCAVKIIQTGIKSVVYQLEYSMDVRTKAIFKESGVEIRQFHLDA